MNSNVTVNPSTMVDFEADLRISITPLIMALTVQGLVMIYLAGRPLALFQREIILGWGCLMLGFNLALALFERRQWMLGRYLALLMMVFSVDILGAWLYTQALLTLAPIAVAFAVAATNFRFGLALAILQTAFVLLQLLAFGIGTASNVAASDTVVTAVIALWAGYAVMIAVYAPVRHVGQWVVEYYQQARELMDETRQRREEHEQLVKDLAQANLQMTRLNALSQGLRQVAETARTIKEQFVASVSHELRTPLNMVIGFSEMMLQSPEMYGTRLPPPLLADLAVIHRNAEHLADLIDDVLDLSQIEADKMALTKESVQFSEIVSAAVQAVQPLYESKGLYLMTEVQDALPLVFCDPTRIREVLLNLLSNAGRFTEHGGVHLCVLHDAGDGEIVVSVRDTGRGISSADMHKLFQPFQQLDGTVRRLYGGTGLGLIISKQFIELHGGTITVQSEPGVGTTFTFRLPIIPPAPFSETPARWLNPDWVDLQRTDPSRTPRPVDKPHFLVVENGSALTRLMTRYTEDAQVEVVRVPSIDQALDELARMPALALLINNATVSKGLDLLKSSASLYSASLLNGIPVLVCAIPDLQVGLGVSSILVKPVTQPTLLATLDRLGVTQGTVLVVDDEPDSLQLFGRMLASSKRGYRVLQARDGLEAMNIMAEHRPEIILLDLMMPDMDGFKVLAALRESSILRSIPTVIISARDLNGQPIMCDMLAVTQAGGISTHHLLACVHALIQILSPIQYGVQHAAPKPPANLAA